MNSIHYNSDEASFANTMPSVQEYNNLSNKSVNVKGNNESALVENGYQELKVKYCDSNTFVKANSEKIMESNIHSASKANIISKKKKILKSKNNSIQFIKVIHAMKNEIKPVSVSKILNDSDSIKEAIENVENADNIILSCWHCGEEFEILEDIKNHKCDKKNNSNIIVYKCKYCSINFSHKHHLDRHMKGHKRNNCTICNELFTKRKALCKHLKSEHNIIQPEKLYHCSFCDKQFSKRPSLNAHLKNHAGDQYFCLKCGFMCATENVYNDHMEEHIKNSKYECNLCGMKFVRHQQYSQHMMGHERHSCTPCNVTFSTKKLLLKHQQNIHGVRTFQKKHACPICKKLFLRPKHLQIHQRSHTGEKPIKCSHCNKNFCNERIFSEHIKSVRHLQRVGVDEGRVVEIEKPFVCSECGARFYQQQSLYRHVEVMHHASESFKCPDCEYTTKFKANFKRHLELHTDIKRFVCEICGSSFHALATLKEHHSFVHSENRCFICTVCNKGFKSKGSLQRHMRIHSEVRPYKCHCNRDYKRMSHLKRHMISAHKMTFKRNQIPDMSESTNLGTNISSQNTSHALVESFEALTDQSSDKDFTMLTVPNNLSSELPDSSNNIVEQLPMTSTGNFNLLPISNCNTVSNKLSNSIVDENINNQLPRSSNGDKFSDVPSDAMQTLKNDHAVSDNNPQKNLISTISSTKTQSIYLQTDHHTSVSLEDHNLNLSPNYCSFNLPSSPLSSISLDNVASTLQNSIASQDVLSFSSSTDSLMRPHSLPSFQNQTSNIDSFNQFSLHNSDSPTSIQLPPFLLSGDISSPSHVNYLNMEHNTSKQLFEDSDDILSLTPYASNNELNGSNCTAEHLFSSARDLELWDAVSDNNRLNVSDNELNATNSCANTIFSTNLTCNANNLLGHNLMFSNDSLMVCPLDTNTLNSEYDSLSNLC